MQFAMCERATAPTQKSVEAVVSCLLLEFFIDKTRYSQPARRELYPRFVRPFYDFYKGRFYSRVFVPFGAIPLT